MTDARNLYDPLIAGLPADPDAERFLLGSIMVNPDSFEGIADSLKAEDFSLLAHQVIFREMSAIHQAGSRIDRVVIASALNEKRELERVGGIGYLIDLDSGMPVLPNLDGYVRLVKNKAVRRVAIIRLNHMQKRLATEEDSAEILASAERACAELGGELEADSGFVTPGEVINAAGGLDMYLQRQKDAGVETAWPQLNRLLRGWKKKHLYIIAALTSRGKTAFALNVARWAASIGSPAVIFSHEMGSDELTDRFLTAESGLSVGKLFFNRDDGDTRAISSAAARIAGLPIYIDDHDTGTVPAMAARLRRRMARHPVGLVIVDYLQLVSGVGRFANRETEVASISRALKRMAKSLSLPVIALSQLSRDAAKTPRRPMLADLRESGAIEQDANGVVFLHFTKLWDVPGGQPYGDLEVILAKNRGGPVGTVNMQYHAPTGVFSESTSGAYQE